MRQGQRRSLLEEMGSLEVCPKAIESKALFIGFEVPSTLELLRTCTGAPPCGASQTPLQPEPPSLVDVSTHLCDTIACIS